MPTSLGTFPIEDLDKLLAQSYDKNMQIESIEWKYLTEPGENFGSLMFAVNINILKNNKSEELNVVVKLPPNSAYLQDLFNSPVTFDKELRFYRDVVPAFEKLQFENGFKEKDLIKLVPRYIGGRLGVKDNQTFDDQAAIMLENLNYAGYSTLDRLSGLNVEHTRFAIRELAKLHALTIGLKVKYPDLFKELVLPALRPYVNETAGRCLQDMIIKAGADMKSISELQNYLDSIDKTLQYAAKQRDPSDQEDLWKTFVHNDFWVNNMMFKYDKDGNTVIDMKIVDFQLCLYDYGIKDLLFFLMSSVQKPIIDDHLNDMIDFYYDSFIESVKSINLSPDMFPKSKFLSLLEHCAPIKFEQSIFMAQVIQATRDQHKAPKSQNSDNAPSFLSSTSDAYKEKLMHVVTTFDRKGWLIK